MSQYKYPLKKGFKWMVKFPYTDPKTGEQKIEYKRGFENKRDAKDYEESFLEHLNDPIESDEEIEPVKTFGDVFQEYLRSHKREDMKESTLETKRNIFDRHIFPTFKNKSIAEITDDDIAEWQRKTKTYQMDNGKRFSASFLRTIQSQFNSIINYAYSKGYLNLNPLADIKNMGIKDKRVEYWSTDEYEKFAYCAMKVPNYYYAFEVLYWCGLREGEMLALTLQDVDLDDGIIHVTKTYQRYKGKDIFTSPKTPSSVRQVSMPSFLCDELREYIAMLYCPEPEQRIFPITKSNLSKQFHNFAEEAGLKRITVHGLRHSHVSLLISKKYDIFEVSKRIGHKSIKTTQDIYGHLFDGVQRAIANDLDSLRRN
jgi:integrase